MTIGTIQPFNHPSTPQMAIFIDLDETYRPINPLHHTQAGVQELEQFLHPLIEQKGVLVGWVTGSNLDSALKKAADYVTFYPHFISSSLGTEFHWVRQGQLVESVRWKTMLQNSGYNALRVQTVVNAIEELGIELEKQSAAYQGAYKISYYYYFCGEDRFTRDTALMTDIAARQGIKMLVTKCNPAAGDPENCFDIEFIPTCCGKDKVVQFVRDRFDILHDNTFAFGDSCNDLTMLNAVANSWLVGNADATAKQTFSRHTRRNYCLGILDTLDTAFQTRG